MIEKKLYKPRSLIFCKDRTNHKERIIYNYLLFRLKQEKQEILKEKNEVEKIGYKYKGHYLKITFKELREYLKLTKKKDIIKMFDNLRQIDVNIQFLNESNLNIGRRNKTKFTAKLIGDIREYNGDSFFELTFSPIIIDLVIDSKDYTTLLLEDLTKFKSKYSLILYEILKSSYVPYFNNNQPLKIDLNDFKSLLNVENYNISNLKQRVLNKAKVEIEKETDYSFDYRFLTGDVGKSFQYIEFIFDSKNSSVKRGHYIENKKVKNLTQKELIFLLKKEMPENLLISQLEE